MKQCSKRKDDILLALVAAHEQLLWARNLLSFEGAAANEEVKEGTNEALEVLEGILGTAALDVAVEEAKEAGNFDLCDELRRRMSCDHCPFNDKHGRCWIGDMEQNERGWKEARERWTDEQGRKQVIVHGELEENNEKETLPW